DRLTARGEVGRAVRSSLALETVLRTIVSRAVELSGLDGGSIFEYDETHEEFELRVSLNTDEVLVQAQRESRPRKGEGVVGQTARTLEATQVPDIAAEGAYERPLRDALLGGGARALLPRGRAGGGAPPPPAGGGPPWGGPGGTPEPGGPPPPRASPPPSPPPPRPPPPTPSPPAPPATGRKGGGRGGPTPA